MASVRGWRTRREMTEEERIRARDEEICDGFYELEDYWEGRQERPANDCDDSDPVPLGGAVASMLGRLIDDISHPEFTKCESPIEQIFFREFRALYPKVRIRSQVWIGRARVDFLIGERTVVECDGAEFHSGDQQNESDRQRDAVITSLGYLVFRFSGAEIMRDAQACIAEIVAVLR